MSAPLGTGMWIWRWDQADRGDVKQVITRCNRSGIKWLAICTNTTSMLSTFQRVLPSLKVAGIRVFAWRYNYPTDVNREILGAKLRLDTGCDGYILNPEVEWKTSWAANMGTSKRAEAKALIQGIRDAHPTAYLSYAPFALPLAHYDYPYAEFSAGCDSVMPQLYWTEWGARAAPKDFVDFDKQWAQWNANHVGEMRPILPIGVTYGRGTPYATQERSDKMEEFRQADLADFIDRYSSASALSLYSYEAATPQCWDYLERLENVRQVAGSNVINRLRGV